MEVNSRAAFSISEVMFTHFWPDDNPALRECKLTLQTWSGECLDILGFVLIKVSFNKNKAQLPLLVAGEVGASMIGRNWCKKLEFTLHGLNNLTGTTIDATLAKLSLVIHI